MPAVDVTASVVAITTIALGLGATKLLDAQTTDSCAVGASLPAYAHNDYENHRPLYDALALGYQGVEVDVHLVRGALLVGHGLADVRPTRTLESLYLHPLRAWVERCGRVLPGRPFLLNIKLSQYFLIFHLHR